MNILAFNSSPRDHETSKTELVLQQFLEGATGRGRVETLYLRDYKINHCLGCYSCWLQTPGRCVQKDDMTEVLLTGTLTPTWWSWPAPSITAP